MVMVIAMTIFGLPTSFRDPFVVSGSRRGFGLPTWFRVPSVVSGSLRHIIAINNINNIIIITPERAIVGAPFLLLVCALMRVSSRRNARFAKGTSSSRRNLNFPVSDTCLSLGTVSVDYPSV